MLHSGTGTMQYLACVPQMSLGPTGFLGFMSTAIHGEFSLYFASKVRKKDAMDGSLWSAARRLAASCQASPIEEDVSLILEFLKRSLVLHY